MILNGTIALENGIVIKDAYVKVKDILFSYDSLSDSTATDISEVLVRIEIYENFHKYKNNSSYLILLHRCIDEDLEIYFSDHEFDNYTSPIILAYIWIMNKIYTDMDIKE